MKFGETFWLFFDNYVVANTLICLSVTSDSNVNVIFTILSEMESRKAKQKHEMINNLCPDNQNIHTSF